MASISCALERSNSSPGEQSAIRTMKKPLHREDHKRWRVMRISHASSTPALRERERAFARLYPEVDLSVVTTTVGARLKSMWQLSTMTFFR